MLQCLKGQHRFGIWILAVWELVETAWCFCIHVSVVRINRGGANGARIAFGATKGLGC